MTQWISVHSALPLQGSFVSVKIHCLFSAQVDCYFVKKYFVVCGENISKWVTHWMPLADKAV